MRHLLVLALVCAAAVVVAAAYLPDMLEGAAREPRPAPTVARLERSIAGLERQIAVMEQTAERYAKWRTCVSLVPVNEEATPTTASATTTTSGTGRDGPSCPPSSWTPRTRRRSTPSSGSPAETAATASRPSRGHGRGRLARHLRRHRYRARLLLREARVARAGGAGGQDTRARAEVRALRREGGGPREDVRALRRVGVLSLLGARDRVRRRRQPLRLPLRRAGGGPGYRSAIAVDTSEWDDPDYEFLAFVGRDRPFADRECEGEPGEGVD